MNYNFFKTLGIVVLFLGCWSVESNAQTLIITGTWILDTIIQDQPANLKMPEAGPGSKVISTDEITNAYYSMFAEVDLFFSDNGEVFFVNLEERDPGGFYHAGTKSDTYEWTQEEGDMETYPIEFLKPDRIQITLINGVKMIFRRGR